VTDDDRDAGQETHDVSELEAEKRKNREAQAEIADLCNTVGELGAVLNELIVTVNDRRIAEARELTARAKAIKWMERAENIAPKSLGHVGATELKFEWSGTNWKYLGEDEPK